MSYISKDSKIKNLVISLLKLNIGWAVRKGKKHNVLIAPNKRKIAIPSTPSDSRAFQNFAHSIKKLIDIL